MSGHALWGPDIDEVTPTLLCPMPSLKTHIPKRRDSGPVWVTSWLRRTGTLMDRLFGTICNGEWIALQRKTIVWLPKGGRRMTHRKTAVACYKTLLGLRGAMFSDTFNYSNQFANLSVHQWPYYNTESWAPHLVSECSSPGVRTCDLAFLADS